jgi:hypothetical protein
MADDYSRRELLKMGGAAMASGLANESDGSGMDEVKEVLESDSTTGDPANQSFTGPGNDAYTPDPRKVTGHNSPYEDDTGFTPALDGMTAEVNGEPYSFINHQNEGRILKIPLNNPQNYEEIAGLGGLNATPLVIEKNDAAELWVPNGNTLSVRNAEDGSNITEIPGISGQLKKQDGTVVRTVGNGTEQIDPENYQVVNSVSSYDSIGANSLNLFNSGKKFAANDAGGLRIYDLENDQEVAYNTSEGLLPGLSHDPDKGLFYGGLTTDELAAFDEQGNLVDKASVDGSLNTATGRPPLIDGEGNVSISDIDGNLYLFETDSQGRFDGLRWKTQPDGGPAAQILGFGDILYTTGVNGISIIDKETGNEEYTMGEQATYGAIAPASSSGRFAGMNGSDVLIYDPVLEDVVAEPGVGLESLPSEFEVGETDVFDIYLENTGGKDYSGDLELSLNWNSGSEVASDSVSIGGGESYVLPVNLTPLSDDGSYSEVLRSDEWFLEVPTGLSPLDLEANLVDGPIDTGSTEVVLFADSIYGFNEEPQDIDEIDPELVEDLNGDGSSEVSESVEAFGEHIRGNQPELTEAQREALDWDGDGDYDIADLVNLFGKQIRR